MNDLNRKIFNITLKQIHVRSRIYQNVYKYIRLRFKIKSNIS